MRSTIYNRNLLWPPMIEDETTHELSLIKKIPLSEPSLDGNAWLYIKDALDTGWVSSVGPYVDRFESEMAEYIGVPKAVATVNGTAALHMALILSGVQPGDEVIVPSLTFIATINVIRYVGAIPVFLDSQKKHWNADPAKIESLITPKTKAIIAVHLFGHPMPMDSVLSVAKKYNLAVIEDAAEALGATWKGKQCGSIGHFGCFSFNGNKTLTTGGGGLLVSPNPDLIDRARYLINQAKDDPLTFTHNEVGYNYRLTNLQAALGVSQLEKLPEFLERRREIFDLYDDVFWEHPPLIEFSPPNKSESSCWLYGVALNEKLLPCNDAMDMVKHLNNNGIQARPFFKPGHLQKPFLPFVKNPLPYAEKWHEFGFNLPSSVTLTEYEQYFVIDMVLAAIEEWWG